MRNNPFQITTVTVSIIQFMGGAQKECRSSGIFVTIPKMDHDPFNHIFSE